MIKINFLILFLIFPILNAFAASFRIVGNEILIYGSIESDDASRFESFLNNNRIDEFQNYLISFNSNGGNLYEGMLIGNILREKGFESIVKETNVCYSACAIAFLGGTKKYVTNTGIGRNLEVGGKLGFHGYSVSNDSVILFNEAIQISRIMNAMILQYALEMEGIDIKILLELLSVNPSSIKIVKTPKEILGLGIKLIGTLPQTPQSWANIACTREVELRKPQTESTPTWRINKDSNSQTIYSLNQFHIYLINDIFPNDDQVREIMNELTSSDFIDIMTGIYSPKFPIKRIAIQRGAGMYYDYCYAIQTSYSTYTILVEISSNRKPLINSHGKLGVFADNATLW